MIRSTILRLESILVQILEIQRIKYFLIQNFQKKYFLLSQQSASKSTIIPSKTNLILHVLFSPGSPVVLLSKPHVLNKLGVTAEKSFALLLGGFLDTVPVGFPGLVVGGVVFRFSHFLGLFLDFNPFLMSI